MRKSLSLLAIAAIFAASSAFARAQTLPELFRKAKDQVKFGAWSEALGTLQRIDTMSQQPGLENDRTALEPVLAFYRGVCDAALDRPDEAKRQFALYLQAEPAARLDPAAYPKKAVAAFDEARKAAAAPANATVPSAKESSRIAAAYHAFRWQPAVSRESAGEDWADGPVQFLMTPEEQVEFRRLTESSSRAEFIENFWVSRDPKGESSDNGLRAEFEKRAAFADQVFVQGETRGSLTDRGRVFVLLGPPTYSEAGPMPFGDDRSDPTGKWRHEWVAPALLTTAANAMDSAASTSTANWLETWRYLRADLPKAVPFASVDFAFITKPGYGKGVLQKDPPALNALDRAKAGVVKAKP